MKLRKIKMDLSFFTDGRFFLLTFLVITFYYFILDNN
jgi:hypothetical protein